MSCWTGWETIATWLAGISTVVAPMRAANLHRVDVGGETADEVVLGQPADALLVGEQVRQRRGGRSLRRQPAQA